MGQHRPGQSSITAIPTACRSIPLNSNKRRMGAHIAVLASEDISFDLKAATAMSGPPGGRRILYYRNPMGLPDTSPVPKKDWMGMDYIPVYESEEPDDGKTVKVSLDKVQRSGVRTEAVEARVIVRPVRAVGTVMHDESRLTIVRDAIGCIH